MDRRESMPMLGSPPLYMQRGMSELHGPQGASSLPNSGTLFHSHVMGNMSGSALVVESSPAILPDGLGVATAASLQLSATPIRRKRGRPRKYGPDGRVSLALNVISTTPRGMNVSSEKRGRGRPPGSGRKQQIAPFGRVVSGSAGVGFTPHVITVEIGEDIAAKIFAFAQQGPRAVCILSANGSVSTAILRQPSTSGSTITYEGRYDILCMSGSLLLIGNSCSHDRSGGLSVSLVSPDGRVIGGVVGGMLIAASPVQIVVGSFIWTTSSTNEKIQRVTEGGGNSQHSSSVDNARVAPPSQNLIATSPPMGSWQTLDMRNSHVDIDLMRR